MILNRLIQEKHKHIYDEVGNLLTKKVGDEVTTYTYNDKDQLEQITTGIVIENQYTYDISGNRLTDTSYGHTTSYVYDGQNNLINLNGTQTSTSQYTYDANGERLMKCNQTHFYYYYYDGVNLLFVKKDNAIDMRYLYDNEGNVYCAIANDGLPYWHHTDIRGSVTNVLKGDSGTSSSPTLIRSYVYNAYGDTDYSIFTGGETFNANSYLAYTGAILDQETGLYYLMSRYYDPKAGSFISQDSYKGEGDAFWHLYAYCDGDPVNNIDKTGHAKVTYTESKAAYNAVKKTKLFKIFPWKNGYVYNKSTIFSSRRGNVYQIRITSKSKRPPTYVLYVYRGSKNALKAYSEYLYDHSKKWNLDSWLNAIGVTLGFTSII